MRNPKLIALIATLVTFGSFLYASAAPYYTYQPTLLPKTDNAFDLGTSTQVWRDAYITQLCLSGDCKTAWPTGGSSFAYPFPGDATTTVLTFSNPPIFSSLTGILKGNGASAIGTASNGTDYTLISGTTCSGTDKISAVSASGAVTCSSDQVGVPGAVIVSTSTNETAWRLAVWTSTSGSPARLGEVATTSLTATSPLSLSQPISVIGSAASALSLDTSGIWSGNAGTATKLATARAINGTNFDGSAPITITAASSTLLANNNTFSGTNTFSSTITGSISGNAGTVTNGVYTTGAGTVFLAPNGSAAALTNFPTLNQNTTGSAATLTTPRAINGVNFDGSAAITITAASSTLLANNNTFSGTNTFSNLITGSVSGNAGTATALAGNGTNCSAGSYALGVDASGNAEGCTSAPSWPWTVATNYGVSTNSTSTPSSFTNGGIFASTTGALPALALSSSNTGRALEITTTGNGPGLWFQCNGTGGYCMTGIMKGESVNPIDIAHNPDNPTSVTSFSFANNSNAQGPLLQLANNGTNKGLLLNTWTTSDWAARIHSQGYGLYVTANGAGGSVTPFKVGSGTATSTLLELNSSGNLAIGDFQTITHRLEVGSTTGQNTARINGLSTANNAPVLSLFRSGTVEWGIAAGGALASDFVIASNPNSTYTDASLGTNSINRLVIKSATGNVGIGTTTPYARLSVAGPIVGEYFTATSTTLASTFPFASTTALSASYSLCINGDCRTAWPAGSGTVTSIATTYPITGGTITDSGTIGIAFGTTTSNTWAGTQTFTNAPILSSLTGLLKGNGASAVTAAANGTDYTLITANTCGAGTHVSAITAAGLITCSADSGGSGTVSTSTNETAGYIPYWTTSGATPAKLGQVATTTLTASGVLSLSQPVSVIGSAASALTITGGTNGQVLAWNGGAPSWVATTTLSTITGTLAAAKGGTGLTTFGGTNTVLYTTAADTLASEAAFLYAPTTDLLTVVNATTTALSVSTGLNIPVSATQTPNTAGQIAIDSTSGQLKYSDVTGTTRVLSPLRDIGFAYSTSTWTGTTTLRIGPAPAAITVQYVYCETDTGTVGVSLYDGTNRANYIPTASSTIGKNLYSSNNTFTAGETMRVDAGTPATTPHSLSCRFVYTYDAD